MQRRCDGPAGMTVVLVTARSAWSGRGSTCWAPGCRTATVGHPLRASESRTLAGTFRWWLRPRWRGQLLWGGSQWCRLRPPSVRGTGCGGERCYVAGMVPDPSSAWRARLRVAAHAVVAVGLVVATVATAVQGQVSAAAACVLATVFFVDARRANAAVVRAERAAQECAGRAVDAEAFADAVRVRAEETLDLAVAAARHALPQDKADEMVLAVLAHRENLEQPPT